MDYIIETKGITRDFPIASGETFRALKGISMAIPARQVTILKGPSGSGKTTLLNILGALDDATEGTLSFDGKDITHISEARREKLRRNEMGFIFQSVSLIPIMTAYENVEFALRMAGKYSKNRQENRDRVETCLKMVGLGNRMHHMPQEMSGGEQQRVAIARAIAHRPKVIFADEPTAELDSQASVLVMNIFRQLVEQEDISVIMTTHDVGLMDQADRVFELEDGELK